MFLTEVEDAIRRARDAVAKWPEWMRQEWEKVRRSRPRVPEAPVV